MNRNSDNNEYGILTSFEREELEQVLGFCESVHKWEAFKLVCIFNISPCIMQSNGKFEDVNVIMKCGIRINFKYKIC